MKWLYIKNGDAARQTGAVFSSTEVQEGGPDAFLSDFLKWTEGAHVLVLSTDRRAGTFTIGKILARTIDEKRGTVPRVRPTVAALWAALKFAPHRIVCGCVGPLLWVAAISSVLLQAPLVISRHSRLPMPADRSRYTIFRRVDLFVIRRIACAVVAHGPFLKSQVVGLGRSADEVFEFDVAYRDWRKLNAQRTTDPSIAYVGRLHHDKGVTDLLDAMEYVWPELGVHLTYVGSGPAEEELRKVVVRRGRNSLVTFAGALPHSSVQRLLCQTHVLVAPTRDAWEGRCMSVMEALITGTPAIAPRGGAFTYLIEHGKNGLLYEPNSQIDLAASILSILKDNALHRRLSQGALDTGRGLVEPVRSFSEALDLAFEECCRE